MTDSELSDTINRLFQHLLYGEENDEKVLRPPASAKQIADCEEFLGRKFSPSYRHFLSLHNGWEGFNCSVSLGYLFGTEDYITSSAHREKFALATYTTLKYSFQESGDAPIPESHVQSEMADVIPDLYYPENFYRFIDTTDAVPAELQPLKDFVVGFQNTEDNFLYAKHTLISDEMYNTLYLDVHTLDLRGEMEIVADQLAAGSDRYENFYDLLKRRLEVFES